MPTNKPAKAEQLEYSRTDLTGTLSITERSISRPFMMQLQKLRTF